MKEAADAAEEIRKWVSLTFNRANLLKVLVKGYLSSLGVFLTGFLFLCKLGRVFDDFI